MDQIILAFEQEKNNQRVKEILETSGTAACLLCGSADQVRQTVNRRRITAVVCGYKLGAQSARLLAADLPLYCSVLVLATRDQLDLLEGDDIVPLPLPTTKRDLITAVETLLRVGRRLERLDHPCRPSEEQEVIRRAKALLMERDGMTEAQAHRFLQKHSMDHQEKLLRTAQAVLDEEDRD